MTELWSGFAAAVFAAIHVWGGRLAFLGGTPRSIWLSLAGGISVAYVFLHLLPQMSEGQAHLDERVQGVSIGGVQSEIYLVALAGLTLFYGLERLAQRSRRTGAVPDGTSPAAFALHMGSFSLYNVVIGYLLVHGERDNLAFYAAAMGLHFVINDRALREHHQARYDRVGRWLLAAAVFGGWWLALRVQLPQAWTHLLVALLAGGVILNVIKEELPQERESRFGAFVAGIVLYGALLLLA